MKYKKVLHILFQFPRGKSHHSAREMRRKRVNENPRNEEAGKENGKES